MAGVWRLSWRRCIPALASPSSRRRKLGREKVRSSRGGKHQRPSVVPAPYLTIPPARVPTIPSHYKNPRHAARLRNRCRGWAFSSESRILHNPPPSTREAEGTRSSQENIERKETKEVSRITDFLV